MASHGNRRPDARMRIVAGQLEISVLEIMDVLHARVQFHLRQRPGLAGELQARLFEVIGIEVQVSEGVDEGARPQLADLGDHHREQGIGADIKRHAQEQVGAALVKLAVELTILNVKLKQRVAGRQRHLIQLTDVPRADNQPPALGLLLDLVNDLVNLVDAAAVRSAPVAPLRPVYPAQVPVLVRPLVPDRHPVLVQVLDISIPAEEPEQFVNDGLEMDPLRRQQREASGERKPRLSPEYGISARASAVPSALPVLQYMAQQIKILSHSDAGPTYRARVKKAIRGLVSLDASHFWCMGGRASVLECGFGVASG